jgi:hypothetical protein
MRYIQSIAHEVGISSQCDEVRTAQGRLRLLIRNNE